MKRKRCPHCKGDPLNERRLFEVKYLGAEGLHTLINHPEVSLKKIRKEVKRK